MMECRAIDSSSTRICVSHMAGARVISQSVMLVSKRALTTADDFSTSIGVKQQHGREILKRKNIYLFTHARETSADGEEKLFLSEDALSDIARRRMSCLHK